jgi:hypothetical protein
MTDILLGSDGDLLISEVDGDFVIGLSDAQHAEAVLRTSPGDWFFSQDTGAGLERFIKDEDADLRILSAAQYGLERDGALVKDIQVDQGDLTTEVEYK